ncbi:MAG TPA: hypothetical protein VFI37_04150 [Gaiellaceae bacterium]|jgi:hypothetical protein|nr:hypothetical protein [Gaiellaceae bacterium]
MTRTPERDREPRPADEVEVIDPQTGRRYRMRPAEPGRYDWLGFSWIVWLVFWLAVIGLACWAFVAN